MTQPIQAKPPAVLFFKVSSEPVVLKADMLAWGKINAPRATFRFSWAEEEFMMRLPSERAREMSKWLGEYADWVDKRSPV